MRLKSILNHRGDTKNEPKSSAVESTVSEYVKKSTIHGVAYVGDDERNKFERIWWFVMLVCSIFGACYLIYQAYRTMIENPIIESPALSKTPLWDVPFPAITICSMDLSEIIVNDTIWQSKIDESYPAFLQKTLTNVGICVTFNMYDQKDLLRDGVIPIPFENHPGKKGQLWSRDSGFTKGLPLEDYTYPFRAFTINYSFSILFDLTQSGQFILIVHPPDEVPLINRHVVSTIIKPEKYNHVKLTPHLVVSEGIEKYTSNFVRIEHNEFI